LRTFLAFHDLELYLIAFLKTLISFAADCAVVNKNIRTILASDEPKSFGVVEPLDGTLETRHLLIPPSILLSALLPTALTSENLAQFSVLLNHM